MLPEKREKNYYEILEVSTNAAPSEVYEGYIRAKNAYSQDSVALYSLMTKDECDNILLLIDEAYSIISDPNKRQQYDEARGISNRYNAFEAGPRPYQDQIANRSNVTATQGRSYNNDEEKPGSAGSITKIVANNKYQLDYSKASDMEQFIEQNTEWTGEALRKIREYKKVSIERLSELTKVSRTYLTCLETEEMDKLPAIVYIRGFVYTYAKCLKLNPDLVANSFILRVRKLKGIK
ncbi:MAG: helix-turn-helix domain-containing protein [Bdellovibrionota bacterium]